MNKMKQTDQSLRYEVLDPCLLGRPVHLLHTFAAQLQEDFSQAFRVGMNRRYWAAFAVDAVSLTRATVSKDADRWIMYTAPAGTFTFSLERKVLLSVLNYRYGRRDEPRIPAIAETQPVPVRITATEERLAVALGQQLSSILAARIAQNLAGAGETVPNPPIMKAAAGAAPAHGNWTVRITVRDLDSNEAGQLWLALDHASMSSVLRGLSGTRDQARTAFQNTPALASQLQLRLTARLVKQEVLLGDLLDIRVGDVIPVHIAKTDVLLEDSHLFTAAVTEHKGKLCLTSFEDTE